MQFWSQSHLDITESMKLEPRELDHVEIEEQLVRCTKRTVASSHPVN